MSSPTTNKTVIQLMHAIAPCNYPFTSTEDLVSAQFNQNVRHQKCISSTNENQIHFCILRVTKIGFLIVSG